MMHFSKMVDMAKTPADVKQETADYAAPNGTKPTVAVYPYGLCLSMEEDTLAKLGLQGDLPTVGDVVHLCANAKVTSVSQSEREDADGKKKRCCRVELQITQLGVPAGSEAERSEEQSAERRSRWYGGGDADESDASDASA